MSTSSITSSSTSTTNDDKAIIDANRNAIAQASKVSSSIDETLRRADALTSGKTELDKKWEEFQNLFKKMNEKLIQNLAAVLPFGGFDPPSDEFMIWHGRLGKKEWPLPICVVKNTNLSRGKYTSVDSSEYKEANEQVLDEKIELLAQLIKKSQNAVFYTGAGISVSAGVADYASGCNSTVVSAEMKKQRLTQSFLSTCEPTYAHRAAATLVKKNYFPFVLQQCHDGLFQKADMPLENLCPIHGEVFDPTNPVVPMTGQLRPDLAQWMRSWSEKTDFTLAVGTSLSGMASDLCAKQAAKRFLTGNSAKATEKEKKERGQGLAIVAIQQTQMDQWSSLRIFAKIDDVMKRLMKKLKLEKEVDLKNVFPLPEKGFEWVPPSGERIIDDREGDFIRKARARQILNHALTAGQKKEILQKLNTIVKNKSVPNSSSEQQQQQQQQVEAEEDSVPGEEKSITTTTAASTRSASKVSFLRNTAKNDPASTSTKKPTSTTTTKKPVTNSSTSASITRRSSFSSSSTQIKKPTSTASSFRSNSIRAKQQQQQSRRRSASATKTSSKK